MRMTNGQRADLIEALRKAVILIRSTMNAELPVDPADDEPDNAENRALWTDEMRRYRQLRRKLLAEEKRAK
jgi:hypothetical protein